MMKVLSRLLCLVLCLPLLVMGQERITWKKDWFRDSATPSWIVWDGGHFGEESDRERPVHTVALDGFYMDVNEVTVCQSE